MQQNDDACNHVYCIFFLQITYCTSAAAISAPRLKGEGCSPDEVVNDNGQVELYLLATGDQLFLVIDFQVLYELPTEDSATGLLTAFLSLTSVTQEAA